MQTALRLLSRHVRVTILTNKTVNHTNITITSPFSTMSWMDSWSRPSANSKIPAPLYLSHEDVPYCHTCGRVMSSKKATKKQTNIVKYCSDKCRSRKPGPLDRKIERTIAALLNEEPDSGLDKTAYKTRVVKGDHRVVVTCDEIEEAVFGSRFDPEKVFGRRKNRKSRAIGDPKAAWKSVDMDSDAGMTHSEGEESEDEARDYEDENDAVLGVRVRPPQTESDVNFSVGGERGKSEKITESNEDREKRLQGARRAEEREMVRRAARRGIVFGFKVAKRHDSPQKPQRKSKAKTEAKESSSDGEDGDEETEIRKAEALMNGTVVEPSFAKGDWSIRWRE